MFKLKATIIKDIRILLRDRVGLLMMFIMPIVLVVVVTSIQNSTFSLVNKNRLSVLISNTDSGKASKQFIEAIGQIGLFKVEEAGAKLTTAQMSDAMHQKDAMLGIIIPADFSAKVAHRSQNVTNKALKSFGLDGDSVKKGNNDNPLTIYYNPVLQESIRLSVQGAIGSAQQMVESRETLHRLYFAINNEPLPQQLENEMLKNGNTISTVPVSKGGAAVTPNATQHNVPAWTIFAMFFVIMSLGGSVVREKISGSFIRLKTLPTSYMVNIASKQVTYMLVTVLQAAVIFAMGIWLFPFIGLPKLNAPSDVLGLIVVTLATGWCAVSYAICVGTFTQTQDQANGFGAVSIVILACIGGLMVPTFAMQGFFRSAAAISPMHWCLQAYYALFLENAKLADVLNNIVPLLIITVSLQFITYLGLKRKNLI